MLLLVDGSYQHGRTESATLSSETEQRPAPPQSIQTSKHTRPAERGRQRAPTPTALGWDRQPCSSWGCTKHPSSPGPKGTTPPVRRSSAQQGISARLGSSTSSSSKHPIAFCGDCFSPGLLPSDQSFTCWLIQTSDIVIERSPLNVLNLYNREKDKEAC